MTTPMDDTDDGPLATPADLARDDALFEERLRQAIQRKMAGMSREELRMWLARTLGLPLDEVIIDRTLEGDGDSEG